MLSRTVLFEARRFARQLWFRPAVYSLIAIATVSLAVVLPPYLPFKPPIKVTSDAIEKMLTVLASSMLAVVTFSLSALVSALAAATQSATPRATTLLMEDGAVQNTLSTFVGAFLFAVVGILGLSGSIYAEEGRFVLFVVATVVLAVVVVALVNWIDRISRLGRVGETIDRVERATAAAFAAYAARPSLGAAPDDPVPTLAGGEPVHAGRVGYVQHIDVEMIAAAAEAAGTRVRLAVRPGAFIEPTRPIAVLETVRAGCDGAHDLPGCVREAVTIGDARSFEQDPRFGMVVLAEIASRALSPGINDPGTAIDVIGTAVRLLWQWQAAHADAAGAPDAAPAAPSPWVSVPLIDPADVLQDAFRPIARDGAATVEVATRLGRGLCSLARIPDPAFAAAVPAHLTDLIARMRAAGATDTDITAVERAVALELAVPGEAPAEAVAALTR